MSDRPYIGRNGRRYTSAIESWHPAVIRSLGIRKCTAAELAEPDTPKETGKAVAA